MKLVDSTISFGPVVVNSFLTKKVQIINSGDLAADFRWENKSRHTSFVLTPTKGRILPAEQLLFDCTFSPQSFLDYRCEFHLNLENSDSSILTLTGKGVSMPDSLVETVAFETAVRTKTLKLLPIKNTTQSTWNLKPTITTDFHEVLEYFATSKSFDVPPGHSVPLPVTFAP